MINIERALQTDGYMSRLELEWLASQANTHQRIVEIGSFKGRSTLALGCNTSGYVAAVDDFRGILRDGKYDETVNLKDQFISNCFDLIESGKILQVDSIDKIHFCPDMIFIDCDHTLQSVMKHLDWALSIIDKDGLLCGHDYGGEVKNAVKQFFTYVQVVPGSGIWFTYV